MHCYLYNTQKFVIEFQVLGANEMQTEEMHQSGGFIWITELCCCQKLSVFYGSIFETKVNDKTTAESILKLIYHWSCQSTIKKVESWVKVGTIFV